MSLAMIVNRRPSDPLPEDREICEELLRSAWERGDRAKPLPELVVEAGERFLGAPYAPDTLEREGPEELVVNLRAFDCITFVENAIVLAGLIRAGKTGFADYLAALERIRYRRGRLDGYASRLHYFTDWLYDNERKGIVRDVTCEIGGVPFRKAFYYLTDRREDHSALKDPATFRRLRLIEGTCTRRPLFYIPKADLTGIESRIAGGDIIAITTDEKGIDVSHAGTRRPPWEERFAFCTHRVRRERWSCRKPPSRATSRRDDPGRASSSAGRFCPLPPAAGGRNAPRLPKLGREERKEQNR